MDPGSKKLKCPARQDQTFYPKMPLEGVWLHPHGSRSPSAEGWMGTITMCSSPLRPQHQGVPGGSASAGISCWEEGWR